MQEDLTRERFEEGKGYNFAACRLPGSEEVYFFYSSQKIPLRRITLEDREAPAFVCSPYAAGNLAYLLTPEKLYKSDQLLFDKLQAKKEPHLPYTPNFHADQSFYTQYVQQCIQSIQRGDLDKVVAARSKHLPLHQFDAAGYFHKLTVQYPSAMVYYFHIDGIGCWMGASPEKLLQVEKHTLSTVALAGTLPADSTESWTSKEEDEQQMVADFIAQVFEEYDIPYTESEQETVIAGSVKHLCNTFSADIRKTKLKDDFHKFLGALNPTPAVCGLPQFDGSLFISHHEKMERRFYSGFIGISNGTANTLLHVNLRCMELGNNEASLYAGAGITAGSDPLKEWAETERKMQTLLSLM